MAELLVSICDCPTKDALVCKEHPDCRPSYCKLSHYEAAQRASLERRLSGRPIRPVNPDDIGAQHLSEQMPTLKSPVCDPLDPEDVPRGS